MNKPKLIRTSTVPISLNILLKGQLAFLSQHFEIIGISSNGADLDEVQKRENIRVLALDMQRNISPFNDLVALIKMYRVFKKEKPLLVHSITPKAGLLTMLAGKAAGVPYRLHTFTGLVFPSKSGFIQKLLIKTDQLLCWAATHVYPEGNGVKNDLINYNITSKPLKVLANGNVNGIDVSYFSPKVITEDQRVFLKQSLGILTDDFVYVFVGRLVGDKGINELVMSYSKLKTQNSKLLLVGAFESDLDPLQPETLKEIENNSNIICVGFQVDVRPYFAVSDCLVFPSYREGFPNVVMQAGAMGLPSIVTDINGCNEIILDGENGAIVPPNDEPALLEAMIKIYQDIEWRNKLKAKAQILISSRYNQELVWEALLAEYEEILQ